MALLFIILIAAISDAYGCQYRRIDVVWQRVGCLALSSSSSFQHAFATDCRYRHRQYRHCWLIRDEG